MIVPTESALICLFAIEEIEFLQVLYHSSNIGEHLVGGQLKCFSEVSRDLIGCILAVAKIPDRACGRIEAMHVAIRAIEDHDFFIDNASGEPRSRCGYHARTGSSIAREN